VRKIFVFTIPLSFTSSFLTHFSLILFLLKIQKSYSVIFSGGKFKNHFGRFAAFFFVIQIFDFSLEKIKRCCSTPFPGSALT